VKIRSDDWARTFNGICQITRAQIDDSDKDYLYTAFFPKEKSHKVLRYSTIIEKIDIRDYPEYTL